MFKMQCNAVDNLATDEQIQNVKRQKSNGYVSSNSSHVFNWPELFLLTTISV